MQCTSDLPKPYGSGLQWAHCLVYLDNVIILGRSFGEHIKNLNLVLQRLREANLNVKPSKCSFLRREVQYLGHNISREEVIPGPSKTEKVATWPVPVTPKEVQQFLGLAGYYRQFVKTTPQSLNLSIDLQSGHPNYARPENARKPSRNFAAAWSHRLC